MEYKLIYRKFRPRTFDDVIGQQHIVRTLTNQIESGRIGHAYLFTGTRGTGKTSCAKILARAVNCLTPKNGSPCGECAVCKQLGLGDNGVDVIEIDAASNNGVDEIRAIRENVLYRPTVGRYKVYIIDEVHMLSSSAFNALLKTLEEPPEHVVFILATTEVQKVPQTILSRCIRFDFRLIEVEDLVALLKKIFNDLGIQYDERALIKIAVHGEGSVRDTLSTAELCISYCVNGITYEDVLEVLCTTDFDTLDRLACAILDGDTGTALGETDRLLRLGRTTLARDLANYLKELISVKNVKQYVSGSMTEYEKNILVERSKNYSNYRISRVMEIMASMENQLRFASQPRILMEANVVRACEFTTEVSTEGITGRLSDMEEKLAKIEETGVRVVEKAVVSSAESPARPPQKEEKKDLNALLSSMAVKKNEELIFEENTEERDAREGEAKEIWSRIKERISESDELTLQMVCDGIDGGVSIEGDSFVLTTSDNATYEMLTKFSAQKTLSEFVRIETNGKLKFICRKKEEKGLPGATRASLNELFDGRIKFRN